jgi:biopolymer transport protein ExbB
MKRNSLLMAIAMLLVLACPAWAADFPQAAREVKADLQQANQAAKQDAQRIKAEEAELTGLVKRLGDDLAREKARLERLRKEIDEVRALRAELDQVLAGRESEMKELAGTVRGAARDLLSLAEASPATAREPKRLSALEAMVDKAFFPGLDDITSLMESYFTDLADSGSRERYQGEFVDMAGRQVSGEIVRLGTLTTLYRQQENMGYLLPAPSGRLAAAGGEPPWLVAGNLQDWLDGATDSVYLDISRGAALEQMARSVSMGEQLMSGGPLIWPILAVGLLALVFTIERIIFLRRVAANTGGLVEEVNSLVVAGEYDEAWKVADSQAGRPTSNMLKAGLASRGQSQEVLENALTEAILHETPRLERFLPVLKVLAAAAPLLGLLGTVTGMINTFHVITSFGTGDPRLMAGGISEALVTTQLGLAVAIPVLVAATLLSRRAKVLAADLEEKAVALTAALLRQESKS